MEIDDYCRARNIGFILTTTFGPAGFTFLDYGNDFIVTDADGEDTKAFIVVSAT